MQRTEVLLLAGALVIAALGFLAEAAWGHDYFARSGSLIVIYAVAFVGRAFVMAERARARNDARFEKLEAAYHKAANEGDAHDPEIFSRLAEVYGGMRESQVTRSSRLIVAEGVILCFGTFIWGFGDLAV